MWLESIFEGKLRLIYQTIFGFLTLPFIPELQGVIFAAIGGRYTADTIKWMYWNRNSEIKSGAISADQYVHISFTYICKD